MRHNSHRLTTSLWFPKGERGGGGGGDSPINPLAYGVCTQRIKKNAVSIGRVEHFKAFPRSFVGSFEERNQPSNDDDDDRELCVGCMSPTAEPVIYRTKRVPLPVTQRCAIKWRIDGNEFRSLCVSSVNNVCHWYFLVQAKPYLCATFNCTHLYFYVLGKIKL